MPVEIPLPDGKADAVLCPREKPIRRNGEDLHVMRNRVFGPVLGFDRVKSCDIKIGPREGLSFIRRLNDNTTYRFTVDHYRHPEVRHDWFVANESDGYRPLRPATDDDQLNGSILVGYLKDDREDS